jgi:hypothetical protein
MKTNRTLMLAFALGLLGVMCITGLTGCAAAQLDKLRKKIPSGYADTLNAKIVTLGGWGGGITGKNIESNGRGSLTADEYSEYVSTPWLTYSVDMTGSGIGKKKVVAQPESEKKDDKTPNQ